MGWARSGASLADEFLESHGEEFPHNAGQMEAGLLPILARAKKVELDSGEHRSAIGW